MRIQIRLPLAVWCLLLATIDCCKYRKFSDDHSFCKEPNENCNLQKSEVTDDDKQLILRKHNEYRLKIATGKESRAGGMPRASNILEMVWDDELASIAQKWANQCQFRHDCNDCRKVDRFSVGQNMYTISSTGDSANTKHWGDMIDAFYDEVRDFHKNNIKPFRSQTSYGHLTQVIWANSWRIGCGEAVYKEFDVKKNLLVCNYGPAGNIEGGEMYKEGSPCTGCPSGTCCCRGCQRSGVTSAYHGLCKVLDENNFKVEDQAG